MTGQHTEPRNSQTLVSGGSYQKVYRVNFKPNIGGYPLTLTVRKNVKARAGFTKFGLSTHVFTFQQTGATTRGVSRSSSNDSLVGLKEGADGKETRSVPQQTEAMAAAEMTQVEGAEEDVIGTEAGDSDTIDLIHDRYNGGKQLYVNRVMVYSVSKEYMDGSMNSWVIPLWFGKVVLRLTSKVFSVSGFEYKLSLDDETVLFKAS